MAKSLKNFVTVADVLRDYPAPAVRTLLAGAQYRSPIDFSTAALDDGKGAWERLATFGRNAVSVIASLEQPPAPERETAAPWRAKFTAAIEDDFNSPEALAVLFDLVSTANPLIDALDRSPDPGTARELVSYLDAFDEMAEVLGVSPNRDWPDARGRASDALGPLVEYLLELREQARKAKDFAGADAIRDRLAQAGVVVEDRPSGPRWRLG
jgi:cysteinyl-tRNA synthetase